jgi:hypothetical protein
VLPFAIEVFAVLMAIDCRTAAVTLSATEFEVTPFCAALIFVVPVPAAVAKPEALMVATEEFDDDQVTELVRFCELPSLKVPDAVNWSVVPFAIEVLAAEIVMDCSVAAVTLSARVLDVIPLWEAVTLVEPTLCPVASPFALIVATLVLDEVHVTELLMFCVLPSVNVPVAVN